MTETFEEVDAQLMRGLYEKYKNFRLIVDYNNKEHLTKVQKFKLPFYFINPVTSFDQMHGLIVYHPTDMYICEALGFSLDKVSKLLHDNNIRVRVYPNICQSSFPETPSIKTFFIRPEDISAYAAYVDIFELITDEARQQVLFKIYKQEKWFGKIEEVIPSFKGNLDSRYLVGSFGAIRARCGKRCMYRPDSCNICDRFSELANTFAENKIVVRKAMKKD